ncbi:hypothetical protein P3X46_004573 [Hevea brasiliensis]|uniref:HAT C-terminal dimerisation domain-containing protein n=1 Tax=Hevea brasiliensis TaxID=3981 RepID=A0ABQ9MZH1_HEVBR|nr:hypothetical protein P3X46_004573 [Hevea brasiliensis]
MNQNQHIEKVIEKQSCQQIENNRLRLKVSCDAIKWLTFQTYALRGHDESSNSKNRGNFIELIKLLSSYNDKVESVVLENAPQNASYISPKVQKEILHVISNKVRDAIRDEIGDGKFCIIVDEAKHFFDLVNVLDTTALTKKEISDVLARHNLSIKNIQGQGYDRASIMHGEWFGLQALFLSECPYAYYIHCFAHRLQLALVATSREVIPVHQFFSKLTLITTVVTSSSKRHDQLQAFKLLNSHLSSVRSLVIMFEVTYLVLKTIIIEMATYSQRGDANYAYNVITSFEFVFILHLMKEILEITDDLCKPYSIISKIKMLIQKMRESGWDSLLESVKLFCEKHEIDIPNMNAHYNSSLSSTRNQRDPITFEHYFRVDVFIATIDSQLQELNVRFKEDMMELLILSSSLDLRDGFRSFRLTNFAILQIKHFELDIQHDYEMQKLSTISEMCQYLVKSRKSTIYPLIDRLVRLVLTLLVSTATNEQAFSAMSLVKTKLHNKMRDDFLANSLITYIEKEITDTFSIDSIIDEFYAIRATSTTQDAKT